MKPFKAVTYKQNQFDAQSCEALEPLLTQAEPNALKQLSIIDCKIPTWISEQLVDIFTVNKCLLQKMALVHCNLTDPTFKALIKVIHTEAPCLTDLDLSWCERNSADFLDFYKVLAENTRISHLNLSWNSLLDQRKPEDEELAMHEDAEQGLQDLLTFIRNNGELVHLDLSNTDLQEAMLRPLIETISESSSLLGVHLCGNPGVREDSL